MHRIRPNARTIPAERAVITMSAEPPSVLDKSYDVSTEAIWKGRRRGVADCRNQLGRPKHPRWRASEVERATDCDFRRMTSFALHDFTFTLRSVLLHLNRNASNPSVWHHGRPTERRSLTPVSMAMSSSCGSGAHSFCMASGARLQRAASLSARPSDRCKPSLFTLMPLMDPPSGW